MDAIADVVAEKEALDQLTAGLTQAASAALPQANPILTPAGEPVYEIRSMVVWLNTETRKSTVPPPELATLIDNVARTQDYRTL